jgi:hypothetical protein
MRAEPKTTEIVLSPAPALATAADRQPRSTSRNRKKGTLVPMYAADFVSMGKRSRRSIGNWRSWADDSGCAIEALLDFGKIGPNNWFGVILRY